MSHTVRTTAKTALAVIVVVLAAAGLLLHADVPQVPSNTWAPTSDMSEPRAGAASSLLFDGHVLVTGGMNDNGVLASAERYSPDGGLFLASTTPMQFARANHTSILLPDGQVLVAGGVGSGNTALSSAEVYDPATNAWHPVAPLNIARSGHTATALYDGRVVIAGGNDGSASIDSIEIYDPWSETFELVATPMTAARTGHAAALTYDDVVVIAGGSDGQNLLDSIDVFDPAFETITAAPALEAARAGLSATTLLDGKILLLGGLGNSGELASGEIYDPANNTVSATANSMMTARQRHQAVLLPHNSQVLIVGGTNGGNAVAGAEVYVAWQGDGGTFFPANVPTNGDGSPRTPGTARAWSVAAPLSFVPGLTIRSGPNDGLMLLTGGSPSADSSNPTANSELYGFATVKTDKADYAPGTTVTITGGGWQPGETVTLTLVESPLFDTHMLAPVVADSAGNITSTEFAPDLNDIGIRFFLTASGSQSQAQTSFTDSETLDSVSVGAQSPAAITPGSSAAYTVTVGFSKVGGNATCIADLTISGLTPGASLGSFTPASLTQSNSDTDLTSTLTLNTTGATATGTTSFTVTATGHAGSNCAGTVQSGTGSLAVVPATTLATSIAAGTYGGITGAIAATLTKTSDSSAVSGKTITFKLNGGTVGTAVTNGSGVATLASGSLIVPTKINAGTFPSGVAVTFAGDSSFGASIGSNALTVNQKAITVTANTNTKTYDGTTSATSTPTITVGGPVVAGDTANFTETYDTKNAGASKTLTPTGTVTDGNGGANYSYTFVTNTAGVINTRAITVTAVTNTKTYDGTTSAAATPTVTSGAIQTGDTAGFIEAYADKNAGTNNKTLIPSGSVNDGNGGANYTVTFVNFTTGTINKSAITVTAAANSKTYDGTTSAITAPTFAPALVGSDTPNFTETYNNKNVGTSKPLTPAGTVTDGNSGNNYSYTFTSANTGTIAGQTLTVTAATNTKQYDGTTTAAAVPTITAGTLQPGDTANFTEVYNNKNAGTGKTLTPAGTVNDGNGGANYTYTFVTDITGVITARALTVTAAANSKTYDSTTSAAATPTITSGALQGTDTNGFVETYDTKNVGSGKTLTPSGTANDGNSGNNYSYTFVATTNGTITARALTVTAAANSKNYDATTSATTPPTITSGTLQGSDTANFIETYNNKNVGTNKTLTPSGTVNDGNSGNNYTYTFTSTNTGTITARALTVTAATNTKSYDGTTSAAATPTITSGTLQGSDTGNFNEVYSNKNVGNGKTLTPSGTVSDGNGGANYTVTFANDTTGVITSQALTVTAATNTKGYDGTTSAAATPTVTSGAIQPGDIANFIEVYSNKNADTGKTLTPSGTVTDGNSGNNYTYTFVADTTGVITPRLITVTAATNTKTYDSTTTAAATPTITSGTLAAGDTTGFTETYDTKNVGTGKTLTPAGSVNDGNGGANYAVTFANNTTGVINARALTVTAATNSKTYDGTTSAAATPTITVGALQGSDTANFTETYDSKNVGTNKTLTPSGTVNDGNSGNNYTYTFASVNTGTITARAITVTAATNSKTYDSTTSAAATPTVTSGTIQTGDTANFTEVYNTKNVGTGKTLTPSGTVSDGNSGNNYTYTFVNDTTGVISARPLTVTAAANTKIYDSTTSASAIPMITSGTLQGTDNAAFTEVYDTKNVGSGKTLTPSGTVNDGSGGSNYAYTFVATTNGVITARPLTVTAVTNTKVYDGTSSAAGTPTITSGTLQGSETASFIETYDSKAAGTGKTLTPSGSVNDGNSGNNYSYTFTPVATGIITAKALTVTGVTANDKTYDATTAATLNTGAAALVGVVSPDAVTLNTGAATGTFASPNVGTNIVVSIAGLTISGTDQGNYSLTQPTTTANITKATPTVTVTGGTFTFDGGSHAATATATGVGAVTVTGSFAFTYTPPGNATAPTNAGTYAVNASFTSTNPNYGNATESGSITINKLTPTFASLTASPTITYGTATVPLSGKLNGYAMMPGTVSISINAITATGITLMGNPNNFSHAFDTHSIPAGAYTITYAYSGDANANPASDTSTTLTVNPKAASVTPNAANKTYGAADPTFTGTFVGFLASDGVTATYSRTAGETVGGSPYTISATLSPAGVLSNYTITYNTANFAITPAAASVTPNTASKTYGAADPTFAGTLAGFLAADGVTATYSRTPGETVGGSPYTISATLSPAGVLSNYNITYNTASFTITAKAASVTPNPASKTYGTADPMLSGTLNGFLAADGVTATYARTPGETVTGSPYTISATLSPGGILANYAITYNTATFTITPAAASVTPNPASKIYGSADPALTGTLSGFLAADGVTATYSRTPGETVMGGPYTISATLSPAGVLGNYNITYNTATFTITPAAASVTPNPASKIYGSADPAFTGTLSGFLAADGVTATYTRAAGETVAGSPYTISAVLSPAAVLGNYSITHNTANFTINPAALSVTANDKSKTYGTADPMFDVSYGGFVNGDTSAALGGALVFNFAAHPPASYGPSPVMPTNVATYSVRPSGLTSGNYAITYHAGTYTISPALASVTPNAASKTYGTADPVLTGTLAGFLAADAVTATYSRTVGETVGGSPYTISATLSPAGVLSNYTITYNTATFTISPATASVTPNPANKTYGSVDPVLTGTLSGFVAADGVTAIYSRVSGETVGGSPYLITATLSPAAVLGNYTITYNTANFTINPALASVTPNPASKTYGSADPAFTGTLSGFVAADGVTATYSRTAGETVGGNPYAISATLSPAAVLGNYSITYNTASFTITPAAASVTPNAASKTYGTADPALSGTLSGFLAADGVAASYSRTAGESVGGSPYTISATLSPAAVLGNYMITYNTASFTITQATASVTPNPASKVFGAADPAFTGTLVGFLAGDNVTATYSRTAGESVAGSPYTISATLSPAGVLGNYTINYNTAAFTINTAPSSTVVTCPASQVYTESPITPCTVAVTGAGGLSLTPAPSYSNNVNVGTATANYTYIGDPNHTGSNGSANFSITAAAVTITAGSGSSTFDGTSKSPSACVVSGIYIGSLTCANNPATVGPGAGTTTIAPVIGGPNQSNFTVTPVNGSYTINKANATIVVAPYNVAFDGNPHTATGSATGVLAATLVGLNVRATTHTAVGSYTDPWTFTDVTGNYNDASGLVNDVIASSGYVCDTASTIPARFSYEPIASGRYIWFNNIFRVLHIGHGDFDGNEDDDRDDGDEDDNNENEVWEDVASGARPVTFFFTNQVVTFKVGTTTYTLPVPDGQITFSNAVSVATTNYSGGKWFTTLPAKGLKGRVFASGLAYKVPVPGLPGNINPVNWTAKIASDTPGLKVRWRWGASVYSSLGPDSPSLNLNGLGIKVASGNKFLPYTNNDRVGTPENFKGNLLAGARSHGHNPAGWRSRSATTGQCGLGTWTTYTQSDWSSNPSNPNNAGSVLAVKFNTVYPGGSVRIGSLALGKSLTFTSAAAIRTFLPAGGKPGVLQTSATNPSNSKGGNFAGQVLSLQLTVDFSNAAIIDGGLALLKIVDGDLEGQTVQQVLDLANSVLGDGPLPAGITLNELNDIVTSINENFDGGKIDRGFVLP